MLTDSPSFLSLNHFILIGKYFLYINALEDKKYQFTDFITLVKEKIDIEKYIAAYWQEINNTIPKVKEEIMNQVIWNNRFIRIKKYIPFHFA